MLTEEELHWLTEQLTCGFTSCLQYCTCLCVESARNTISPCGSGSSTDQYGQRGTKWIVSLTRLLQWQCFAYMSKMNSPGFARERDGKTIKWESASGLLQGDITAQQKYKTDASGTGDGGGTDELLIYVQLLYITPDLFNDRTVFCSVTVWGEEGMSFLGSESNSDAQVHPMYCTHDLTQSLTFHICNGRVLQLVRVENHVRSLL